MTTFTSSTLAVPAARRIPRHIAVIMDGNGRWAKQRYLPRVAGHRRGVKAVRSTVRACAEQLGAPVALTPKAKGVVPEDHPLFLGVLDMAGDAVVSELLDEADLIIAVGCDIVELDRAWSWAAPVIHVDITPNVDHYYEAEAELIVAAPEPEFLPPRRRRTFLQRPPVGERAGERRGDPQRRGVAGGRVRDPSEDDEQGEHGEETGDEGCFAGHRTRSTQVMA